KTARATYAASVTPKRFIGNESQNAGAQGRIRTSVPRKEEQIYSLPALTTHPPVQKCRLPGSPLFRQPIARIATCASEGLCLQQKIQLVRREGTTPLALNSPQLEKLPYGMPLETRHCRRAAQMACVPEPLLEEVNGFDRLTFYSQMRFSTIFACPTAFLSGPHCERYAL